MKKSFLLIAIAAFAYCNPTIAQKVSFANATAELTPELSMEAIADDKGFGPMYNFSERNVELDGNDVYILSEQTITKFADGKKMSYCKKLQLPKDGNTTLYPQFTIYANHEFHFFACGVNGDDATLYQSLIDKKTGAPTGKVEKVLTFKSYGKVKLGKVNDRFMFRYDQSPDTSKILLFAHVDAERKMSGVTTEYDMVVLDNTMKVLWQGNGATHNVLFGSSAVDNDGRVSIATDQQFEKNPTKAIYRWSENGGKPFELKMNYKVDFLRYNNEGTLLCATFYAERDNSVSAKGLSFFTVNSKDNKIENTIKYDFPDELMKQAKDNGGMESEGYINSLRWKKMIPDNNGGVLLMAERSYFADNVNYSNSIIAISIAKGKVEWSTAIPKYQKSKGITGSFATAAKGDKVFILYNDDVENFDRTDHKFTPFWKQAYSEKVLVTLNANGKWSKEKLGKNDVMALRPVLGQENGDRWSIICGDDYYGFNKLKVLNIDLK